MKLTLQVVLLLLFSADATRFSRNPYLELAALVVIILLNFQSIFRPSSKYLRLLFILITYFSAVLVFGSSFNRYFAVQVIFTAIAGYGLYKSYGQNFIQQLSQVIVVLTTIAMGFYVLDVALGRLINNLVESANLGGLNSPSILVYTTHHTQLDAVIPRNAGFAFEPGPFSIYCALGLILERIIQRDFDILSKRSLILVAGIITAQSTTGIFLLLVFLFLNYIKKFNTYGRVFFSIVLGTLFSFLIVNVSFLGEKVEREYNQDYEELIALAKSSNSQVALGRFGSFLYEYREFISNPYFGSQGIKLASATKGQGELIGSVNALGIILSHFGVFGALIVFIGVWDVQRLYSLFPSRNKDSAFFWWFLIAGFGFRIVLEPLILVLLVFGYLNRKN